MDITNNNDTSSRQRNVGLWNWGAEAEFFRLLLIIIGTLRGGGGVGGINAHNKDIIRPI